MPQTLSRKDQIRSVAQQMFREKGYAATSMRDLAKNIGIEPASLYSHICSKEQILDGICFQMAEAFFVKLSETLNTEASPEEQLHAAIKGHMEVILNHVDAAAVFFHDWRFLSEPALSRFKEQRKQYEQRFRDLIEAGIVEGSFRSQNVQYSSRILFAAMNHSYDWLDPENPEISTTVINHTTEQLLNGIKN